MDKLRDLYRWLRDVRFSPGTRNFILLLLGLAALGIVPALRGYVAVAVFFCAVFVLIRGGAFK